MNVHALHHVTIYVEDLARARAFYGGVLGLTEVPRPRSFTFQGAWFQLGPAQLHLMVQAQAEPPSSRHFALQVLDVAEAQRHVENAGVEVKESIPIPGTARFMLRDPDGNLLEIIGPETPWTA